MTRRAKNSYVRIIPTSSGPLGKNDEFVQIERSSTGTGSYSLPDIDTIAQTMIMTIFDKDGNAGTNNLTLNPAAGETIEGNATYVINQDGGWVTLAADGVGTDWKVVGDSKSASKPELHKGGSYESPTASDFVYLGYTARAITVSSVRQTTKGTTPSVTSQVKHDTDLSAAGNNLTDSAAVTNTTTGATRTLVDATIPAGSHIWIVTTAVGGTVDLLSTDIIYTED